MAGSATAGSGDAGSIMDAPRVAARQRAARHLAELVGGWNAALARELVAPSRVKDQLVRLTEDPALGRYRGEDLLRRLPESERGTWRTLWAQVAEIESRLE